MTPTETKANPVAEIVMILFITLLSKDKDGVYTSPDYFNFNYIAPNLLEFHLCKTNKYCYLV